MQPGDEASGDRARAAEDERRGDAAAAGQRLPEALDHYERSVVRYPQAASAVLKYHDLALRTDALRRAETCLREACIRHPGDRRLRFLRIDLLLRRTDFGTAMDEIESAMADFGVDDGILAAALSVRARLGRYVGGRAPSVSLCMIVKDEAGQLARCLHSAKRFVDEIVVVDTGSNDASKAIAGAFGAVVVEEAWQNDFAKARNRSLDEASGDWVFVLDADEVISPQGAAGFRRLLQAGTGGPLAFTVQTRNYSDRFNTVGFRLNRGEASEEKGAGWFPSDKVRLFPNDPRIRFRHPVHEVVEPALAEIGIPAVRCDIPVHHYGKLGEERTAVKTRQYRTLGSRKLSASPNDPAALREAAIQASHLGRHEDAIELWQRFARVRPDSAEAFVNLAGAHFNLRRYPEAAANAEKAMDLDPSLKEAQFNAALAYLILGHTGRAVSILEPLLAAHPEYPAARFVLAACHACAGSEALFADSLRRLSAGVAGDWLPMSIADVAERMLSAGRRDSALVLLRSAVRCNFANPVITALIAACTPAA
jgi:tetratricopeptide (TPR) repeat protein